VGPSHKGHDIVDIADIIAHKKENIKRETENIEEMISQNKARDTAAEKSISKSASHYSDLGGQAKDKRKQWHVQVDSIFDTLESLIQLNQIISV
jgi:hypothetical protein